MKKVFSRYKRFTSLLLVLLSWLAWLTGHGGFSAAAQEAVGSAPARRVRIEAVAGMQYSPLRFRASPGERIRLIFINTDDMSHNLLVTAPGQRAEIVEKALALGEKGPGVDYIPASPGVRWFIRLLEPGEKDSVEFVAPGEEGAYPYVCTFPGHGAIMYGAMYVTDQQLPPLETDPNIPEAGKSAGAPHPYQLVPPYFYRMYMPDASPAAIAVRLSDEVSYCWDAGTCQLLYSWNGGFVDNSIAWKGHRDAEATLLGTVFYKAVATCPLRLGDPAAIPDVNYLGFRLVERYPEFYFTVNGVKVYQLVKPDETGRGLVLTFRIPGYRQKLWLDLTAKGAYRIATGAGRRQGNLLAIPAGGAEKFSLRILPKEQQR